jgi:hypothetical protein
MNSITAEKLTLLKLPISISEAAWLEAVYIDDFLYIELNRRLNTLFETTYREILLLPKGHQARHIDYGLYRFEPCGKRTDRVWLDLRLRIEYRDTVPSLLRVTLRDEVPIC